MITFSLVNIIIPVPLSVIPAKAGIQKASSANGEPGLDSRLRGNDGKAKYVLLLCSLFLTLLFMAITPARADAQRVSIPAPGPTDSCPVCGMFPAKYPDWVAAVQYKQGHVHYFDGPKDFFKYLLDMKKFASGHKKQDIIAMGVTDYYATRLIDPKKALYVIGSDVLGPMGHDLVPHPDKFDAGEFMKDHKGKRILTFDEITMELLLALDKGEFLMK